MIRLGFGPVRTAVARDDEVRRRVLETFHDAVTEGARGNGRRRRWWYTWLASRDRLRAPLLDQLAVLEVVQGEPGSVVTLDDPWLAAELRRRLRLGGHPVRASIGSHVRWAARRARAWAVGWMRVGAAVTRALRLRRLSASAVPLDGYDVLVATICSGRAPAAPPGQHADIYFPGLSAHLEARGERVLLVGYEVDDQAAWATHLGVGRVPPVVGLHALLRVRDVVAATVAALGPVRAEPMLRPHLHADRAEVVRCTLVERAWRNLLTRNPAARVIRMHENNPWERAVDRAAEHRHVLGYLHAAIVPAHQKYAVPASERSLRPWPAALVCTGPAAREVLLGMTDLPPTSVRPGCALRRPRMPELGRVGPPPATPRVLVLLEGLWSMVPLLQLAAAAAPLLPAGSTVAVRGHPTLPAADLAARAGVPFGHGRPLEPDESPDLVSAVQAADVVVYQGTTAALTAAALGVPLIHVDVGLLVTDDPLVGCDLLKEEVATPAALVEACARFAALPAAQVAADAIARREYVDGYLRPPASPWLDDFLAERPTDQVDGGR